MTNRKRNTAGITICASSTVLKAAMSHPGESVRVDASDLGELFGDSGEVALYLAPEWSDPDAIVGYVQWGKPGHKREEPAIAAGVWEEGSFVVAGEASGLTVAGPSGNSAEAWSATPA